MSLTLTLDGSRINDIASFYREINRVFMADEDWQLGESLDGLNDLLHGGFGALDSRESATLVWTGFEKNRADLGHGATLAWLRAKQADPARFNSERIARDIADLEAGTGKTYFEIILEIFADHPRITLIPA